VIILNTEYVPGQRILEVKGLVQGNTVRTKHLGRDIAANFKNLIGGELRGYTELLVESRREAMARMMAQARELGANAVVNVRFATSSITAGAAELYCYGTAVVVEEPKTSAQAATGGAGASLTEAVISDSDVSGAREPNAGSPNAGNPNAGNPGVGNPDSGNFPPG
jgi:uncharacterized protein YbjQ (UPF0145 family)